MAAPQRTKPPLSGPDYRAVEEDPFRDQKGPRMRFTATIQRQCRGAHSAIGNW